MIGPAAPPQGGIIRLFLETLAGSITLDKKNRPTYTPKKEEGGPPPPSNDEQAEKDQMKRRVNQLIRSNESETIEQQTKRDQSKHDRVEPNENTAELLRKLRDREKDACTEFDPRIRYGGGSIRG
jgi:hypothetical protein